jgi:hypothetical protein
MAAAGARGVDLRSEIRGGRGAEAIGGDLANDRAEHRAQPSVGFGQRRGGDLDALERPEPAFCL